MVRIVLCFALAGCVQMLQAMQHDTGPSAGDGPEGHHVVIEGRVYRVGPYWGPECERPNVGAEKREVYRSEKEAEPTGGKQPNLSHDLVDQVARLVCVEEILSSETEPERNTWVMQHFRFDELAFDHFTAAMMLVQCLKAGSCLGEGAPPHHQELHNDYAQKLADQEAAKPRPAYSYYQIGMMRWYADHVDAKAVAQKLATLPLAPAAQQAFMKQLDKAKARVIAVSNELAPEAKKIFVDIPATVYQQRTAERAKAFATLTELASLTERVRTERAAGAVSDDATEKLRKLRVAYHATCKTDCTRGPIFAAITKQLFWAYVSRGDAPAAMAESKLLEHLDPTAQQVIAKQQEEAIDKAVNRVSRVNRAREQGIDAEAARSTANGALVDFGDGRYVYRWASDFAIDYNALVPDGHEVGHIGGKVASLERRGANMLVRFADDVSSYTEDTNCYETNRIDGIDSNGKLIYREQCTGTQTHVERRKVDPALVPAREAANLHGGDEVVGFGRGTGEQRLGTIWLVKRGQRVTRLREIAM
jgi:hypothetical protein